MIAILEIDDGRFSVPFLSYFLHDLDGMRLMLDWCYGFA